MKHLNPHSRSRIPLLLALLSVHSLQGQSAPRITNANAALPGYLTIQAQAEPEAVCTLEQSDNLNRLFSPIHEATRSADNNGLISWTVPMEATQGFFRIAQSPAKTVLTWNDLESAFAGTFAIPMAEDGDFRFGYSSGVHTQLANGNLLVIGHPYFNRQAEVQPPSILDGREATRVGNWIDITHGMLPDDWEGGPEYYLNGMLEVGGRTYFTKHQWYNGAGIDWQTQGFYEGGTDGGGNTFGMWTVNNPLAHHSRVGGYMSYPPVAIQSEGFAYLAGLEGTSGAALGRWGPNLFAINPTPSDGAVEATTLICHDTEEHQAPDVTASNATNAWWTANSPANQQWWIANKGTAAVWVETDTHHGVLMFVYRGLGQKWYGTNEASPGLPDPYGGGSGYHAEGWALQAWIYDPADLMRVFHTEQEPWSLTPVEAVLLCERLPGAASEHAYSFFTGSARADLKVSCRNNRIIVLQENGHPASEWENTPKGYVFHLP